MPERLDLALQYPDEVRRGPEVHLELLLHPLRAAAGGPEDEVAPHLRRVSAIVRVAPA